MNELESATKNIRKFKDEFKAMQDIQNDLGFVPDVFIEKMRVIRTPVGYKYTIYKLNR